MNKRIKNTVSALIMLAVCIGTVTGCSGKLTPKKMMSAVTENLAEVKSVSNSLEMDIELEDVLDLTKISMDMEMENTTKPKAGHAKGSAEVNFSGTQVASDMEIYQVTEGDEFVTYSSMYGQWSREAAAGSQKSTFNGNLFQEAGDSIESFHIAKETIQVEDKECYEMYGDISGEELLKFMGLDMMRAFGLVELPEEDAISGLSVPITIDIYKEEMLPARIIVDMTDVMNDLYDKYNKSTNVNDFTIKLSYIGFNQVEKIEVPQEVQQACGQAG
ncbi:hypothetical protein MCI89_16225 [Muricomes sp. OA1]|uniref:Lipoprotein n=1 Tax=Hungatella hathewayi TaxID=154046 RepID=A0A3E2X0H9_9FIRM|nr:MULTISPECIES: DUF6612 family protein [Clostridia]MEE0200062.1 DUF6612 family protein [Muricomes sp.]MCH1973893.1 hypothetical protein [Muricomes sp. OA1]MRM87551.1 hypothetical protein [Faecalicatena contorta]RGC34507.1 hypothetical protein DWX41_03375 [Hungatella hathewayi]GKH32660.1 hypothetical protein CE91St64_20670 [Faecalicatena contorta]